MDLEIAERHPEHRPVTNSSSCLLDNDNHPGKQPINSALAATRALSPHLGEGTAGARERSLSIKSNASNTTAAHPTRRERRSPSTTSQTRVLSRSRSTSMRASTSSARMTRVDSQENERRAREVEKFIKQQEEKRRTSPSPFEERGDGRKSPYTPAQQHESLKQYMLTLYRTSNEEGGGGGEGNRTRLSTINSVASSSSSSSSKACTDNSLIDPYTYPLVKIEDTKVSCRDVVNSFQGKKILLLSTNSDKESGYAVAALTRVNNPTSTPGNKIVFTVTEDKGSANFFSKGSFTFSTLTARREGQKKLLLSELARAPVRRSSKGRAREKTAERKSETIAIRYQVQYASGMTMNGVLDTPTIYAIGGGNYAISFKDRLGGDTQTMFAPYTIRRSS